MKKIILGLAALSLTLSVMAQEAKEKKSWSERREMRGGNNDRRLEMMEKLNLSEDQKAKMKAINVETKNEMDALKFQKFSENVMNEKRMAIVKSRKEKISAILTNEQKKLWNEMKPASGERKEMAVGMIRGDKNEGRTERMEQMVKDLKLSAEQTEKYKILQSSFKGKLQDLKGNTTLTQEQKKEEMKEVVKMHKKSVEELLTPEQCKEMKGKMKQHQHEGEE